MNQTLAISILTLNTSSPQEDLGKIRWNIPAGTNKNSIRTECMAYQLGIYDFFDESCPNVEVKMLSSAPQTFPSIEVSRLH